MFFRKDQSASLRTQLEDIERRQREIQEYLENGECLPRPLQAYLQDIAEALHSLRRDMA
jgi:hypothetical protein